MNPTRNARTFRTCVALLGLLVLAACSNPPATPEVAIPDGKVALEIDLDLPTLGSAALAEACPLQPDTVAFHIRYPENRTVTERYPLAELEDGPVRLFAPAGVNGAEMYVALLRTGDGSWMDATDATNDGVTMIFEGLRSSFDELTQGRTYRLEWSRADLGPFGFEWDVTGPVDVATTPEVPITILEPWGIATGDVTPGLLAPTIYTTSGTIRERDEVTGSLERIGDLAGTSGYGTLHPSFGVGDATAGLPAGEYVMPVGAPYLRGETFGFAEGNVYVAAAVCGPLEERLIELVVP